MAKATTTTQPADAGFFTSEDYTMRTELALLLTYSNPVMTAAQVAELMGIGERTLENKIYDKSCPVTMFKLGSKYAAHISDVAKYIDDQRASAMGFMAQGA